MPVKNCDINPNSLFAKKPQCGGAIPMEKPILPANDFCYPPGYPPPGCMPPMPDFLNIPQRGSSKEIKIAKLAKKASIIRKFIENFSEKNKDVIVSVGGYSTYNFGSYLDEEGEITDYGQDILEMFEAELAKIKAEIIELTNSLDDD